MEASYKAKAKNYPLSNLLKIFLEKYKSLRIRRISIYPYQHH